MTTLKQAAASAVEWFDGDIGRAVLGGGLGGLVRWLTLRERPGEGTLSLVVGSICAVYLGPLVQPILEPVIGRIDPGNTADGFSAFVIGLGGIGLAGGVIDLMRRYRGEGDDGRRDPGGNGGAHDK